MLFCPSIPYVVMTNRTYDILYSVFIRCVVHMPGPSSVLSLTVKVACGGGFKRVCNLATELVIFFFFFQILVTIHVSLSHSLPTLSKLQRSQLSTDQSSNIFGLVFKILSSLCYYCQKAGLFFLVQLSWLITAFSLVMPPSFFFSNHEYTSSTTNIQILFVS